MQSHREQNPVNLSTLKARLKSSELTSVELIEQALEKNQQYKDFNVFITVDGENALVKAEELDSLRKKGQVLGPLHGIPVAIKDNIHVAGLPNTAGSPFLHNFIPNADAPVVQSLKAAGAIVLGKTNMHEWAYGITSNNGFYGPVRNAVNPECIGGGSSGGTAVAVALGITSIGLGTDTGGSSRIPAALNGIAGFRPTTSRYACEGLTRISHTRDTVGPMANSVADIGLMDSLLSEDATSVSAADLQQIRLGVPRDYFYKDLSANVETKVQALLDSLNAAGVELVEIDPPGITELNDKVGFPVVLYETQQLLGELMDEKFPGTELSSLIDSVSSPDVKPILESALKGDIPEPVYQQAIQVYRPQLQQLYRDYFQQNNLDAMIFATTPHSAIAIEESLEPMKINGVEMPVFAAFIHNTDPSSNAGIPGLTLPLNSSAGEMPVGIEIDGPEGSDRRLLAIGLALEKVIADMV